MFLALQGTDLEPVVKNIPAIIKEASQSPRGIFALLIIVLFALALYFFRTAAIKWRVVIFLVLFGGVAAYGWEINRVDGFADGFRRDTFGCIRCRTARV